MVATAVALAGAVLAGPDLVTGNTDVAVEGTLDERQRKGSWVPAPSPVTV